MIEAVTAILEILATAWEVALDRRAIPAPGTHLRNLRWVNLGGVELSSAQEGCEFDIALPPLTLCRVVERGEIRSRELWVQPLDEALLAQVPVGYQLRAGTHGYALHVPRRIWRDQFRAVAAST